MGNGYGPVDVRRSGTCGKNRCYVRRIAARWGVLPHGICRISGLTVSAYDECHNLSKEFLARQQPGDDCPVMIRNTLWDNQRRKNPLTENDIRDNSYVL